MIFHGLGEGSLHWILLSSQHFPKICRRLSRRVVLRTGEEDDVGWKEEDNVKKHVMNSK